MPTKLTKSPVTKALIFWIVAFFNDKMTIPADDEFYFDPFSLSFLEKYRFLI